jgi:transcriptional regulator with XRE-family HTH domain
MKCLTDYLRVSGMTQTELAKRASVDPAALNRWMRGNRQPRVKALRKLADATGISIEQLVRDFK